jgi:hypothetical protein
MTSCSKKCKNAPDGTSAELAIRERINKNRKRKILRTVVVVNNILISQKKMIIAIDCENEGNQAIATATTVIIIIKQ